MPSEWLPAMTFPRISIALASYNGAEFIREQLASFAAQTRLPFELQVGDDGSGDATLEILKRAELAVWPGQSVALVAPSGAGKSTLLHIAGLLEQPDAGEVYLDGAPTMSLSDAARTRLRRNSIGFVYQAHHLLPEFSAAENVILPQMIRGLSRKDAADRLAVETGISRNTAYRLVTGL